MSFMTVAIVDYGSGNLRSAAKAFERAAGETGGAGEIRVTSEAGYLESASHIVLPGVGAFADCKRGLVALPGMWEALGEQVIVRAKPFLGICVGMQLMADVGREHGDHEGLGWIAGEVAPLAPVDDALKVPHMGWNELCFEENAHPLLAGIAPFLRTSMMALTLISSIPTASTVRGRRIESPWLITAGQLPR